MKHTRESIVEAFHALPRSRRGLDRDAVAKLLDELATQVHEDAAAMQRLDVENAHLKSALAQWQTEQRERREIDAVDYPTGSYSVVDRQYYPEQNRGRHHRDWGASG